MTADNPSTLPLQCYNEKCLYYEEKTCDLGSCKILGFSETQGNNNSEWMCELPLEFSFEATSVGDNPICDSTRELSLHQSNQSVVPSYDTRNFTALYTKNGQSYSKDFVGDRNVREIQLRHDYHYYDPSIPTYPPCVGAEPRDYGYCYGSYGNEPCQFSGGVDMEDFM